MPEETQPTIRKRPPPHLAAVKDVSEEPDSNAVSYPVGYKRPPVHSRFQKGRSGNPKGRPKGAKSLGTIVREQMGARIRVQTANGTRKMARIEALFMKRSDQAGKGDARAMDACFRLYEQYGPPDERPDAKAQQNELTQTDAAILAAYEDMKRAQFTHGSASDSEDEEADEDEGFGENEDEDDEAESDEAESDEAEDEEDEDEHDDGR